MNQYLEIEYEDPEKLKLKPNVFIAYNDVSGAGCRALLGIDMRMEYYSLGVPEFSNHQPSCKRKHGAAVNEQEFQPLQVLNCKYEQFSIIVLNTEVKGREAHYVASRIIDLCQQSNVEKIYLLTVLNLPNHIELEPMFELFFHTVPVTSCPSLPEDTKICDPFFSTFIQMVLIEELPVNCLVIPAQPHYINQSAQQIAEFQNFITSLTKLKFNSSLSSTLNLSRQKTISLKLMYG